MVGAGIIGAGESKRGQSEPTPTPIPKSQEIRRAQADESIALKKGWVKKRKKVKGEKVSTPRVAGAGDASFNGDYPDSGMTANGAKVYKFGASHYLGRQAGGYWGLTSVLADLSGSPAVLPYYSNHGDINTVPTTGWTTGPFGTAPAPTVTLISSYATPSAPKITNIHDGDAFTLHNSLPWDASWVSGHGLYVPGLGALNDTDATFDIPATGTGLSQALAYKFAIEDSDVEGPETKIISAPAIVYDGDYIVAPSTRPVADAILTLQLNFYDLKMNAEFIDFAADVEDSDRINVYRKPRNTLFRWKVDFPAGYGGQNGSDEFSTSEPLPWKGQNIAALVSM